MPVTLQTHLPWEGLQKIGSATGTETGFWDDGRPAYWPDDIDRWHPETGKATSERPADNPF